MIQTSDTAERGVTVKHYWATPTTTADLDLIAKLKDALTLATQRAEAAESALKSELETESMTLYSLLAERDALLLRCKEAEAGWLLAATQRDDFAVSLVMARDGGK